ncbi:MAG: deoxyribodipyrimidine photolyase [Kaistia sp. SCN 65-12]|nr:MAG: deoxyribodipyrimidine photolyase [Kaistia sp. SCN 65-12]
MAPRPALVWLRDDLRLADNPALLAGCRDAAERGAPLVIVYGLDQISEGIRPLGGATRWWLHHSLAALDRSLARGGQALILRHGPAEAVLPALAAETDAASVFWNRRYGGGERAVDASIKARLKADDIHVESFHANLLFEPWTVRTKGGDPFRVYTPFWKACGALGAPRVPLDAPALLPPPADGLASDALDDWSLLPTKLDWAAGLRETWHPGEAGAQDRLASFVASRLQRYATERDQPAVEASSRLSPHLRFGEVSPFQLWQRVAPELPGIDVADIDKFRSEIGWREFSWHLLFHQPDLATRNFQPRFDAFPWPPVDDKALAAWKEGRTGIPIVDAGLRELWQTGWMHNRVRMIVASFLVKNLLVDWRIGEAWFWDTLVDADAANNPASWQWVAGSSADAAPYFRIFNPVLQGEKFDPDGSYVRRYVPELRSLPARTVHAPWKAGGASGYPLPIVDLAQTRVRALEAFGRMRVEDLD